MTGTGLAFSTSEIACLGNRMCEIKSARSGCAADRAGAPPVKMF